MAGLMQTDNLAEHVNVKVRENLLFYNQCSFHRISDVSKTMFRNLTDTLDYHKLRHDRYQKC